MKEDISKKVKEEMEKISNKRFKNFKEFLFLIFFAFSTTTTIIFGVYLLPQVIELSETMKKYGWILAIGIMGYAFLPLMYLFDKLKLFDDRKDI